MTSPLYGRNTAHFLLSSPLASVQLAFLLMSLPGLNDLNSPDRHLVDLIWFPTGGGKTEAYLGVTAIVLFLRRLRYPTTCDGTAVIMRYTLRLLTAQQFQRACTLICACELIRREPPKELGESPISIGCGLPCVTEHLERGV